MAFTLSNLNYLTANSILLKHLLSPTNCKIKKMANTLTRQEKKDLLLENNFKYPTASYSFLDMRLPSILLTKMVFIAVKP